MLLPLLLAIVLLAIGSCGTGLARAGRAALKHLIDEPQHAPMPGAECGLTGLPEDGESSLEVARGAVERIATPPV
jgi:hypothetical protein